MFLPLERVFLDTGFMWAAVQALGEYNHGFLSD
jgi:hypothetical protein